MVIIQNRFCDFILRNFCKSVYVLFSFTTTEEFDGIMTRNAVDIKPVTTSSQETGTKMVYEGFGDIFFRKGAKYLSRTDGGPSWVFLMFRDNEPVFLNAMAKRMLVRVGFAIRGRYFGPVNIEQQEDPTALLMYVRDVLVDERLMVM